MANKVNLNRYILQQIFYLVIFLKNSFPLNFSNIQQQGVILTKQINRVVVVAVYSSFNSNQSTPELESVIS